MKKLSAVLAAAAALCMFSTNAFAGDTIELLDHGVVEIAPTIGLNSLHKDWKPGWTSDINVGYGVADFMTISTTIALDTTDAFRDSIPGVSFQLLFTPLDTEIFDVDFFVDFGWQGVYTMAPGLEFNVDSSNDMSGFGAYLRTIFPMYSGPDPENGETVTDFAFALTIGLYYTIMEDNQLFLEGGLDIPNMAKKLGDRSTNGYVSLGYNVEVFENFEIVSEVKINIPDGGDPVDAEMTVGAIIDLPTM